MRFEPGDHVHVAAFGKGVVREVRNGGRYLVDETGARADNPTYGAAAVGDTVGDPLKDAAGPVIHVLVKVLPAVTLVFLPVFI